MPAQINILDEIIVDNFAGDGGGREETMKRLTADHPESNVELAMNLAYVKDSEVWLRLDPDMSLCKYAAAACAWQGCGDITPESIMENGLNDCDDCPVAIAYAAAIQAAELRERLKAYEDAGLSPELSRLALMYDDLSEPLPDGGPAPVVVLDRENHAALHAGRDYETQEADEPVICTKASPASWGRYGTGKQRAYFAVSIKHSAHKWRFGMPLMLWGYKHTEDDETRCFCGYTLDPDCAEWYALGDFELHGYAADVVKSAPVKLELDFCRKYKAFDTVLVPAKDIYDYWRLCGLLHATEDEERSEP